ncbi:hypothetical protein V1512DRAFT_262278 [Lipomyces arxii]|uniref:uncharacterized protein n=1 Tax=Lipomyces arxii TaxID=56418 RepID=UPI0034CD5851
MTDSTTSLVGVTSTLSSAITTFTSYSTTSTSSSSSSSTAPPSLGQIDGPGGTAQGSYGQSISTFVSSLTASLIVFGVEVWLFVAIRKRIRRVYEPKTYAVPKRFQVPPTGRGLIDWIIPTLFMSESDFIKKCGLDAYFFMRYLTMLIFIFFTASLVVMPILLPINGADTRSGTATGLDRLAWVNIGATDTDRYWAHLILAVIFIVFLCAVFHHEMATYVRMRQTYLISPQHRLRASATTVLIRAVQENLLDEDKIRAVFNVYPGGVRNVWFNRNMQELTNKTTERDNITRKLEAAETKLIQKAYKQHKKNLAKSRQSNLEASDSSEPLEDRPVWSKYLKEKERPKHRPGLFALPGFVKKVDTIEWCRSKLNELNVQIVEMQQDEERHPLMNSVFIQFNNQLAAHMACQSLASDQPQYMVPRLVEINPTDIIWGNMRIKWWEALLRKGVTLLATGGLIIGWAFPVAFVGIVSQLSYLTNALPFLDFINGWSASVRGIIAGILPPAALSGLMALLPVVLRVFAQLSGSSTGVQTEMTVQASYFSFLFVQVFLVITIASSITTVIQQLTQDPTSIPALLASNLPKASNFFFSYLILQGLAVSAGALLRVGPLLQAKVLGPILDFTARQKFQRVTHLVPVQWGTFYPIYTNLGAIGIVYTIISPLIMPMCLITFSLFYIAYRYEFIYCTYNPVDSSGLFFHRAINQLFTGIYVMELCLVGLFFLVRDEDLNSACTPQGIIMIVVFCATAAYQFVLNQSFGPMFTYLPVVLEGRARSAMKHWRSHNESPLLASSANSVKNYSAVDLEHAESRRDMKKPMSDSRFDGVEMQSQISLPHYDEDHYVEMSNSPVLQSPLAQLLTAFKKPIATTMNTTTGQMVGNVGSSVGARLGNTADRLGISKPLGHITDFIYTGKDSEAYKAEIARNLNDAMLLEGVAEDLEDLTKDEREFLVNRAFKHESLRAKIPVVWIPHDDLGIADDEIQTTIERFPNVRISSENASLNNRGKVIFGGRPPDYDIKSKIAL